MNTLRADEREEGGMHQREQMALLASDVSADALLVSSQEDSEGTPERETLPPKLVSTPSGMEIDSLENIRCLRRAARDALCLVCSSIQYRPPLCLAAASVFTTMLCHTTGLSTPGSWNR